METKGLPHKLKRKEIWSHFSENKHVNVQTLNVKNDPLYYWVLPYSDDWSKEAFWKKPQKAMIYFIQGRINFYGRTIHQNASIVTSADQL